MALEWTEHKTPIGSVWKSGRYTVVFNTKLSRWGTFMIREDGGDPMLGDSSSLNQAKGFAENDALAAH